MLLPYSFLSPFAHDSFIMSHPLSIITNGRHHVKPFRTYLHAYWLVIYSISTCTPICLLIDSSLADNYSIVLPIILLNSHWTIATIYLQAHSHISTYISTCTYTRDGQLLSWSNLLASFESHQTLTLPSRSILINLATFIVCFASKSETEDQGHLPTLPSS